jgi:hypothetical protein
MVKALKRWLEANGLLAIILGVLGAVMAVSVVMVFGGYFIATLFR